MNSRDGWRGEDPTAQEGVEFVADLAGHTVEAVLVLLGGVVGVGALVLEVGVGLRVVPSLWQRIS